MAPDEPFLSAVHHTEKSSVSNKTMNVRVFFNTSLKYPQNQKQIFLFMFTIIITTLTTLF